MSQQLLNTQKSQLDAKNSENGKKKSRILILLIVAVDAGENGQTNKQNMPRLLHLRHFLIQILTSKEFVLGLVWPRVGRHLCSRKNHEMLLTRTRASVKFVHIAISSRVLMSGYRFLKAEI